MVLDFKRWQVFATSHSLLYSDPSVERFSHTCTWQFWGLFPRSNYISINSDADLMLTAHAPLHFWSTFYDGSRQICAFICNLLFTDDSCWVAFSALTLLVGQQEGHPVCKKTEWWRAGVVICLERGADLHIARLMPLPLCVSCFSKIQIGFTFLVLAHLGSPGQRAIKRV